MQLLTVVNFAAGGVATPADEALMMRLGADGVFTGSGIFKAENPEKMANAVVEAVSNYDNPSKIAEISKGVGAGMKSISEDMVPVQEALQKPDDKSHNPFSHIDYVINY